MEKMFKIVIKNQWLYYMTGVVSLLFLQIFASSLNDPVLGNNIISVADLFIKYNGEYNSEYMLGSIVNACNSEWLYTLSAVIVGIPAVSFVYEQIKNGSLRMYEERSGKVGYICSQIAYCILSTVIITVIASGLYVFIAACNFNLVAEGVTFIGEQPSVSQVAIAAINNTFYMSLYGIMMSIMMVFIMYIYNDLLFDISLIFIIAYKLRDIAMEQNYILPLTGILILIPALIIMWKVWGEKI